MKASAVVLLFSLCTAFHAPLVLASRDAGMDCCAGGATGACCLLPGSCSLRSGPASSDEARSALMSAFAIPAAAAFERPAAAAFAGAVDSATVCSGVLLPPDPPPRA